MDLGCFFSVARLRNLLDSRERKADSAFDPLSFERLSKDHGPKKAHLYRQTYCIIGLLLQP